MLEAAKSSCKVCSGKYGCGDLLPIECFRRHSTTGGRSTYCRDCEAEFDRFRKGFPSRHDPIEIPWGLVLPVDAKSRIGYSVFRQILTRCAEVSLGAQACPEARDA